MRVVFLVPIYNVSRLWSGWAKHIYKLDPKPERVVFCENNSTDQTLRCILNFKLNSELIRFWTKDPKELAWENCYSIIGAARDLLLTRARQLDPDYAIFLDSDILVNSRDMIETLTSWQLDIVGATYLRSFPEGIYVASLLFSPVKGVWLRTRDRKKIKPIQEVKATSAGCLCLSRKVIQDRRLSFTDIKPGDSEDFGFCRKARELGYKVWLDGLVSLTHKQLAKQFRAWDISRAPKDKREGMKKGRSLSQAVEQLGGSKCKKCGKCCSRLVLLVSYLRRLRSYSAGEKESLLRRLSEELLLL